MTSAQQGVLCNKRHSKQVPYCLNAKPSCQNQSREKSKIKCCLPNHVTLSPKLLTYLYIWSLQVYSIGDGLIEYYFAVFCVVLQGAEMKLLECKLRAVVGDYNNIT